MIEEYVLDTISEDIRNCAACDLRKYCKLPVSPYYHPFIHTSEIILMMIADKPSREEDTCNTSWFDREKEYVARLIYSIFPSKLTYFTYLTKCYCPPEKSLSAKTTKICRDMHLFKEITTIKPKFILTMGHLSGKILLSKFTKQPKYSDIFIDESYCLGYYKSPSVIFNESKKKEPEFINYLTKIKTTLTTRS